MSANDSDPLRLPAEVGVKVTLMMQLAPAATAVPQLFVSAKAPLVCTLAKERLALPVLVSVTVSASLVEFRT